MTIKELLKQIEEKICEIRELGEICREIKNGNPNITKSTENNGQCPVILCSDIFGSRGYVDEFKVFVNEDNVSPKAYIEKGDLVIARSGYTKKNKGGCGLFLEEHRALAGNDTFVLKHGQHPHYLNQALSTKHFFGQLERNFRVGKSSLPRIYINDLKKIKIPIPTKDIQEKIGCFLFKFTQYERKLTEEREHRKKQLRHYRDLLFEKGINEKNWELKKIEEISTGIYSGDEVSKAQLNTGDHPAVKCGDINSCLSSQFDQCISFVNIDEIKNKKYCEYGDILVSQMGDKGRAGTACVYLGKEKCLVGKNIYVIKHNQNPKYISYCLSSWFIKSQINKCLYGGIVFCISMGDLKRIKIPVPGLEEQNRMMRILDKLYDICENPNKGVCLLIKNNQKQYEYYKELLFSMLMKSSDNN